MQEYSLGLYVYSPEVKARFRAEGAKVCDEYKAFFDRYSRYQFSKKKQGEYLRFPPMLANSVVEELFDRKGLGDEES